jgi:hypothetical protein
LPLGEVQCSSRQFLLPRDALLGQIADDSLLTLSFWAKALGVSGRLHLERRRHSPHLLQDRVMTESMGGVLVAETPVHQKHTACIVANLKPTHHVV